MTHFRGLAEQEAHVQIDGAVVEMVVVEDQAVVVGGGADHGVEAAFAGAEGLEGVEGVRGDRQDVAFLGFVAPDFHGAHGAVFVVDAAEVEMSARGFDQFGESVGEAAGADVVDGQDRVVRAEGDAGVDHHLAAALHFGIAALHGIEIEILGLVAGGDGGGGAAAEPDFHGGPAELDDQGFGGDVVFVDVFPFEVAHAARGHNGLVVAAMASVVLQFEGAEESAELGASEFVAEGGAADGRFEHNVQRGGHAVGMGGDVSLPGAGGVRQAEVGDHEGGEAGLGAAAYAGGALVADFAAHPGGGAGEGGDGGGVVVGFDFAEDVQRAGGFAVYVVSEGIGLPPVRVHAVEHAGVVGVGDAGAAGMQRVGVADHVEERQGAFLAVHHPVGVENLVAAMLGIHLRKHDQLGVGGIPFHAPVAVDQVVDFVRAEGEAPIDVRTPQGLRPFTQQRHCA